MTTSNQEYFNRAWTKLRAQGPSFDPVSGLCRYRGLQNRACGIGLEIPDEKYVPAMEGKSPNDPLVGDLFEGDDLNFLCDLQGAHDHPVHDVRCDLDLRDFSPEFDTAWLPLFEQRMVQLAKRWGLTVPSPSATAV